ncbi:polysaccharide deacetylase family protein [Altererythrobacter luteolus]|uniref:Polysaccharide deacetylase family protein n=1 Tax=Pontixanthobacter luteolus TaxID=295089 RepID=A0A6I4V3V4_9SPHN|nr:polysaccharide deacetylase family protein [Pontixanthobacter luteolus]MXP48415.1 polysaccharide deacetylase family protein [Pontixanthobacter luteolus]
MTAVYITIDTEYSAGFAKAEGVHLREENFARSIACDTPTGSVGTTYQMDVFDAHGLRGVFFVDPMPALVWGIESITDIVEPILMRGHDVQLHVHTEWLELAGDANPVGSRTGDNIADFEFEDQLAILDYARDVLVAAGAPPPTAFRAGNYGANDVTLRALSELGIGYDTSHPPGIPDGACEISLSSNDRQPLEHEGVIAVPIGCVANFGQDYRHAQITALSAWELLAAIRHAKANGFPSYTVVSHSFELLSRDRSQINHIIQKRFERFCAGLEAMPGVYSATFTGTPPQPATTIDPDAILPLSEVRSGLRLAEQALANLMYGTN